MSFQVLPSEAVVVLRGAWGLAELWEGCAGVGVGLLGSGLIIWGC